MNVFGSSGRRLVRAAALPFGLCAAAAAWAGTLELRQGGEVGAGTGFRRGELCLVLTAAHVVKDEGAEVTVLDRTGARATGQVSYANPTYDVALVTLQPGFSVACSERWPDSDWMGSASWTPRTELVALRHYPNGREAVIALRWAGGTPDTLTLARVDRMEIRSSDSGSLVMLGDRKAGIVKEVDTAVDRVEVLRFDVIDRLLGDRFRASGAGAVTFEGVIHRGRPQPAWTTYVSAWLTESARRPLVEAGSPAARCRVRSEVIDWSQRNVENPRHAHLQAQLAGCKTNLLWRNSSRLVKACEDGSRTALKDTPRQLRVHAIQLKVDVTPLRSATQSRLRTVELTEDPRAKASRADIELQTMQTAFAQVGKELLDGGACD